MAVVKIKFVRHMETLVRYVREGLAPSDPVSSNDILPGHPEQSFAAIAHAHNGKGGIKAIHLIQSWGKDESSRFSAEEFNKMGQELVETKFPGHAFYLATHTDTGKIHNHIVVSPWHTDTGKKIENKKRHLYELRAINDKICISRGLSVVDQNGKDRFTRLPEKVQKIARYNGRSWILDLSQKADFARAYATSYDDYVSILSEFGVTARVEDRNITYFYGGKARGKRGNKLGRLYDKNGLEESFRSNDLRFAQVPGLREKIGGVVRAAAKNRVTRQTTDRELSQVPSTTYERGTKDYARYTKTQRHGRGGGTQPNLDDSHSLVPIDIIRQARQRSIIDYCNANKIALSTTKDGRTVLKGREFVEISDEGWSNKRNRTQGNIIEFVANHKMVSHLQAIAHLTDNKKLLLLEKHIGEVKRNYTSFYVPKVSRLRDLDAKVRIAELLVSFGAEPKHASTIFASGQAQVDQSGRIRLFGKDDPGGAHEFSELPDKKWQKEKHGEFNKPFYEVQRPSGKLKLFVDPFSFLVRSGKNALWDKAHHDNILCLVEPGHRVLDLHLASNPHIREIELFSMSRDRGDKVEIDFFNNLKHRLEPFGISVSMNLGHELKRGREMDLPSF